MANVADVAPVPGQTQAQPPARTSIRGLFAQTEIDLRLFGMLLALVVILRHVPHPERRQAHPADQHGHDGRPGGGHRDHRDRHGPGHRVAQHRPVGRVARRAHRDELRAADDRLVPAHLRHRPGRAVPVGPRAGARRSGSAPASARSRASSSPTSACRRSSSRSAGCCRSAASSGTSRAARPCPASTRPSSSSAAARSGSVGGPMTWILGVVGCVAIVALLVNSRRQRRRYGFPVRPMWAEVLLGVRRLRRRARRSPGSPTTTSGRRASPTSTRPSTASPSRPAACRSRPASRTRSCCSSA